MLLVISGYAVMVLYKQHVNVNHNNSKAAGYEVDDRGLNPGHDSDRLWSPIPWYRGLHSRRISGWSVKLFTRLSVVPRLWMLGALHLSPYTPSRHESLFLLRKMQYSDCCTMYMKISTCFPNSYSALVKIHHAQSKRSYSVSLPYQDLTDWMTY